MCPFQTLHWKHSGAAGIRQGANGPSAASSPLQPYAANTLLRAGDLTLDDHGSLTGSFRFVMTGQEALYWRQAALANDKEAVKKLFDGWLESMAPQGVEARFDHFLGIDNPEMNLVAMVNVQSAASSAARPALPGFFFEARSHHPFVDQAQRQEPVDMHYAEFVTDQVVYHLPAGFSAEGLPPDSRIPWEGHAVFATSSKTESGQVSVTRQFLRAFTTVKPEEYPALRGFYQKVAASDQQQLVLTASPAAKGN
jgi:hypothetical protein